MKKNFTTRTLQQLFLCHVFVSFFITLAVYFDATCYNKAAYCQHLNLLYILADHIIISYHVKPE